MRSDCERQGRCRTSSIRGYFDSSRKSAIFKRKRSDRGDSRAPVLPLLSLHPMGTGRTGNVEWETVNVAWETGDVTWETVNVTWETWSVTWGIETSGACLQDQTMTIDRRDPILTTDLHNLTIGLILDTAVAGDRSTAGTTGETLETIVEGTTDKTFHREDFQIKTVICLRIEEAPL
jgi:hypothetical protein